MAKTSLFKLSIFSLIAFLGLLSFGKPDCFALQTIDSQHKTIRILFLGNSYTYFHELPEMVEKLGNSVQDFQIDTEQITPGGATLAGLFNDPKTLERIRKGIWDYVVLQEQSMRPVEEPESMFDAVKQLDQVIKASGAQTVLYMTWARKSNPEMISELAKSYHKAGQIVNAKVAPVGLAFEACRKEYPRIELHDPDGSHPSPNGSYLAACVIAWTITGHNSEASISGIDKKIALKLQKLAQEVLEKHKSN